MPEKLKKGWARVAFGDVVRLCRERSADPDEDGFERYVGLEHLAPGDLKVRRWGNTEDGTTFTNVFRAGQVLFGKRRAYQRKVAVAAFDGVCSGDIYVLESADPKRLLPELLPFICQTDRFFEHAVGTSAGSLSPRTNWKSLAGFEFALPPLDEQRQIAEVLGAVQSAIDAYAILGRASGVLPMSYAAEVLRKHANEQTTVGTLSKFTSGQQIRVTNLPKEPSVASPIPVYGGNGISGYTDRPMEDCRTPTIVVGRVGQFCGVTTITTGPAWVTDNALYPEELAEDMDMAFLAMSLRAANINRGKLGEYLPLVTQRVVHAVRIPRLPKALQLRYAQAFGVIENVHGAVTKRAIEAIGLKRHLLVHLINMEER